MLKTALYQNRCRDYRQQCGYTQVVAAKLVHCTTRHLQLVEHGQRRPHIQLLFGMAVLYGRTPTELYPRLHRYVCRELRSRLPSTPNGTCVLAVDPYTKGIGVAVLDARGLVFSAMHRVSRDPVNRWFMEKAPRWMRQHLRRYQPSVVVMPCVTGKEGCRSVAVRQFLAATRREAHRLSVPVCKYSNREVEECLRTITDGRPSDAREVRQYLETSRKSPQKARRLNKTRLAVVVAKLYPELADVVPPPRPVFTSQRPRESEFGAIALARTALEHEQIGA